MDERDFYYWLQGFFELSGSKELSEKQVQMIKEHMALVAHKVTPTSIEEESEGEGKRLLTDAAEDPLPRKWPNRECKRQRRPIKRCSTTVNTVCASPQFLTC